MAPKTKQNAESKQGLIVALVFFVLSTLALGVTTYMGYNADDGKEKKLKDKENELKTMTADRDWYRFQSRLFKAYMGHLKEGDELNDLKSTRDKFNSNAFGDEKERPLLAQLMNTIESKVKWDKASGKPEMPYENLLVVERKRNEDLEGQLAKLAQEKARMEGEVAKSRDDLDTARKEFDAGLKKLTDKTAADNKDLLDKKNLLETEVARIAKEKDEKAAKDAEELNKANANNAKLVKANQETYTALQDKSAELSSIKNKTNDAPRDWRTDWKVMNLSKKGDTAYINLGSADKVKEQLTFSIHGLDVTSRKPIAAPKASAEVINVIGDHLSQVRIFDVRNPNANPVTAGDVLYNPSWNPFQKRHVAIGGIIDLTGEGRDQLADFKRQLETQNVVVDAYLDLRDMKVKGPGMSVKTDYLIMGDSSEILPPALNKGNESPGARLDTQSGKMLNDAKNLGINVIGLRKYQEMIGFRVPRTVNAGSNYFHLPVGGGSGGVVSDDKPKNPEKQKEAPPTKEDMKDQAAPNKDDMPKDKDADAKDGKQ